MKTIQGNLITLAQQGHFDVIVHGCNCFCTMGAGIAKSIKQAFPEAYQFVEFKNLKNRKEMNTQHPTQIKFYSVTDEYGEFSNFARYPIKINGVTWQTSEHYFQAMKFTDKEYQLKIRKSPTAMKSAQLGRSRKVKLRPDWESVKENIMYQAVYAKFTQHADLKELLLGTGDATLIENTENDSYWGDGGDGKGKNRLGHILMKVRDELRE